MMWRAAMVSVGLLLGLGAEVRAQAQMFPTKRPAGGLSAYVIPPSATLDSVPAGWELRRGATWGNSALGAESLTPTRADVSVVLRGDGFPRADYTVSILARGAARARVAGQTQWTDVRSAKLGAFEWFELGRVTDSESFVIEIENHGEKEGFFYGGMLAEGSLMPVIPLAPVVEAIRSGGPATVVLLGDSVTENRGGTGGGASLFERGSAGLLHAYLERVSGSEVGYIAHREPTTWKGIDIEKQPARLPTATIDGETVYDARQELATEHPIHLLNFGKGGAAANWGWTRMHDLILEPDHFDRILPKDQQKRTARYGIDHYGPDLVFINFGTNDVNASHADWTPEDYLFHLRVLATMVQQRYGAAVVLSTPHRWTRNIHLTPERQPALVETLRRFCGETGIALADVYLQYEGEAGDGIHPDDAGHALIARAYVKALEAAIAEGGRVSHLRPAEAE